jgi:hypothetical protein
MANKVAMMRAKLLHPPQIIGGGGAGGGGLVRTNSQIVEHRSDSIDDLTGGANPAFIQNQKQ